MAGNTCKQVGWAVPYLTVPNLQCVPKPSPAPPKPPPLPSCYTDIECLRLRIPNVICMKTPWPASLNDGGKPGLCRIELETKIAKDYAKLYNHGEGPYQGLLLVESTYYCFHI